MASEDVAVSAVADREANRSGMRFRKRVLAFATGAAAVSALSLIVVGGPAVAGAAADPTVTPSPTSSGSSDNPFNVNDCDDFVADSSELFKANNDDSATDPDGAGSGEVSGGILTVTVNAGWVVTGVAVKGGPAANLYIGPFTGPIVITGMQPPINPNNGKPYGFSHWLVCGYQEEPPSSSEPPSSEPPSSEPPTTEPPATQTTKTDEPGLPVTGASLGGLIATGVALVAGGVGLLLWRRRRDITDAGAAS